MAEWARIKGLTVLGTGDFTHPKWFREIKEKLAPAEEGLFKLNSGKSETRFILTVEISSIYSKAGKVRRVHNIIFAPSIEAAERLNVRLGLKGNLASDGRPILGLDSKELLKICLDVSPEILFVPAHAWTPWFSIFGSMSGFDSIEECFDDYSKYIYAIETGLSSDPAMNWRLSALDKIALISNSDSHSLTRLGREANILNTELSYKGIVEAIKSKDLSKFLFTIEFFPEEGKYHYDGHRLCNVSFSPEESKKHNYLCPKCGRQITVGVMTRVEKLADRPAGFKPQGAVPFRNAVSLDQIIAESLGVGVATKAVSKNYDELIRRFNNEFAVLFTTSASDLKSAALPEIVEGITRVREGKLHIEPGYDGEYGKIKIFEEGEVKDLSDQQSLF